jgi:hypothetical protein
MCTWKGLAAFTVRYARQLRRPVPGDRDGEGDLPDATDGQLVSEKSTLASRPHGREVARTAPSGGGEILNNRRQAGAVGGRDGRLPSLRWDAPPARTVYTRAQRVAGTCRSAGGGVPRPMTRQLPDRINAGHHAKTHTRTRSPGTSNPNSCALTLSVRGQPGHCNDQVTNSRSSFRC